MSLLRASVDLRGCDVCQWILSLLELHPDDAEEGANMLVRFLIEGEARDLHGDGLLTPP